MLAQNDDYIKDASNTIYQLSQDEQIRLQCEAREDHYRRLRRIARQHEEINELTTRIAEKDAVITDMHDTVAEKDAVIADMHDTVAEKDAVIAEKDARIAVLTAELERLKEN